MNKIISRLKTTETKAKKIQRLRNLIPIMIITEKSGGYWYGTQFFDSEEAVQKFAVQHETKTIICNNIPRKGAEKNE